MRKALMEKYGSKGNVGAIRRFASFGSSISAVTMGVMNREVAERLVPPGNYRHIRVRSGR